MMFIIVIDEVFILGLAKVMGLCKVVNRILLFFCFKFFSEFLI